MKAPPSTTTLLRLSLCLLLLTAAIQPSLTQDYGGGGGGGGGGGKGGDGGGDDGDKEASPPPPGMDKCNGIFLTYSFTSREKEYPKTKNVTAQSWAFTSVATITNLGTEQLKGWQMFIGFQHKEILVSATNAQLIDESGDFPAAVGNGTTLAGYPMTDLNTMIDTAGDWTQIQVKVEFKGTMFGMGEKATPMPKKISLANEGYICPKNTMHKGYMYVCCKKNPKYKPKPLKLTKYPPKRYGDLNIMYDVIQAYEGSYQAQVTMDNDGALSRLDHWNLTWEWMRGEFIQSMRGAYTRRTDITGCLYGIQSQYYNSMDLSDVMNCQKKPVITDLPKERYNDSRVGKIPFCCRNGTLLPPQMDESQSRTIFQLRVFKIPPDINKTALYPPQKWNITGVLNPSYKCTPPVRVDPTEFPDPTGLQATWSAIASWQIICNMTKPKAQQTRCCVSFSSFYNESIVPCKSCACGCGDIDTDTCNANARSMLLPAEALLVPYKNRTKKAKAWASLHHHHVPKKLPCPDNCGVSVHWHVMSDYAGGWTARITLFNWMDQPFVDWFTAVRIDKAYKDFNKVYSFNGTKLTNTGAVKNTIFFQGLEGLNYLVGMMNGSRPSEPRVPGKQQSVVAFTKHRSNGRIDIRKGDGFPTKVYFNGEECALPDQIPRGFARGIRGGFVQGFVMGILVINWHYHVI